MKNDNSLFYTCSLIEFIGRVQKRKRSDIVALLGEEILSRIYTHAEVFHCEVIDSVADKFITIAKIEKGCFDNVSDCLYEVPDYWDIGEVYERLIEDVQTGDSVSEIIHSLQKVYSSWISDCISNYNTDFYYQNREYIKMCYTSDKMIA